MSKLPLPDVDRARWLSGPWDTEPDHVEWTTRVGLPAVALRQQLHGAWCAYVAVHPSHALYQVHYSQCPQSATCSEDYLCQHRPEATLDVHGGVTFSGLISNVAHGTVAPRGSSWWFGFDCAHHNDYQPGIHALLRNRALADEWVEDDRSGTYRRLDYVRDEAEDLAVQLLELY